MSEAPELQTSLAPSACEQLVLVLVLQPVPASQPPRKPCGGLASTERKEGMANNSGSASYTVCSTVALLLASTFVTAQRAPPRPGEEKELVWTCDAKYNGTSCLRDHLEDAQARSTWPVRGLINASNPFIYFTEGHHSPVMEDIIHFMRHAFLDENVKADMRMANLFNGPSPPPPPPKRTGPTNPLGDIPSPPPPPPPPPRPPATYLEVINSGSHDGVISYCYFPMLYYTCAASYQVCKEDTNKTEQLVLNPPPTPANLDVELIPEFQMEWAQNAQELARTPVYPCISYCEDQELQVCKDILVTYMQRSLAGHPHLTDYLNNVTQLFNCSQLEKRSTYVKRDDGDLCILRPRPRQPPPPPPNVPPAPALPPAPTSFAAPNLVAALIALCVIGFAVLEHVSMAT